jgi:ABC-type Fe3+-citrate transport system substrate-binding protein
MRIISMIPSWTETLIKCDINVVGRTRFCIHPADSVKAIEVVGGTKNIDWQKVIALKPDLLLLDQEENPKSMAIEAEASGISFFATHITSVGDVARDCQKLSEKLHSAKLSAIAGRWQIISAQNSNPQLCEFKSLSKIPAIQTWINKPSKECESFIYLIWRKPWMAVSCKTFIGSVFECLGFSGQMVDFNKPYPEIKFEDFDPQKTLLLFSTEPFPFHKKIGELKELPFASALIDGEAYSWFGIRSLEFLELAIRS